MLMRSNCCSKKIPINEPKQNKDLFLTHPIVHLGDQWEASTQPFGNPNFCDVICYHVVHRRPLLDPLLPDK